MEGGAAQRRRRVFRLLALAASEGAVMRHAWRPRRARPGAPLPAPRPLCARGAHPLAQTRFPGSREIAPAVPAERPNQPSSPKRQPPSDATPAPAPAQPPHPKHTPLPPNARLPAVQLRKETYSRLTPTQRLQVARHPNRPTCLDIILNITDKFVELHGDRAGLDDPAIVCGIGSMDGVSFMFIGQQKGRNTKVTRPAVACVCMCVVACACVRACVLRVCRCVLQVRCCGGVG